ncbi:MAG: AI-2E family transporter [Acidobacteriota bacterium]|nr:AI-2E family transporter [Acidobacteriota bacterium]
MSLVKNVQSAVGGYVVGFVGIVLLLLFAKELLIPLAFALVLSLLLLPAVSWLQKRGISRKFAVLMMSSLTCAILLGGAYDLSRQLLNVAETLPHYRANIEGKVGALHSSAERSLEAAITLVEDVSGNLAGGTPARTDALPVRVVGPKSDQLLATEKLAGEVLYPLGEIFVVIIFTIYMLMNWDDLRHRLLLLAGMSNINLMTRALDDATARISRYLVMQLQVNACYGFLFGVGLAALGVPEAALWGVIAGALRIVPFVGTLTGMLLPLVLSIALSSGWLVPLGVFGLFLLLEIPAVNFVEPWLFSSRTGISSLALLASAIFWSMIWGWPGLILSTPLTVCLVVVGRHVPQLSFLHSLLGTNAKLSPAAHLYERLLAMDQVEALSIAEKYLENKPLVKLYDSVVIPVLSLAEEDTHKGALDTLQSKFVLLSLGELVARLTGYQSKAGDDDRSDSSVRLDALRAPHHKEFAVVCLTAGGQATELTTLMLTQLLEREGHQTVMFMPETISDDILSALAAEKDTVIFISALPPFAFAQARAVCQRVRTQMPDNRIAMALWGSLEDGEELLERFGTKRPTVVLGSFSNAVRQVRSWQRATRNM